MKTLEVVRKGSAYRAVIFVAALLGVSELAAQSPAIYTWDTTYHGQMVTIAGYGGAGGVSIDDIESWSGASATGGFSGDGGPASLAQLNVPTGTAIDNGGYIYIADTGNCRLRKINPLAGTIGTLVADTVSGAGANDYGLCGFGLRPEGIAVDRTGAVYWPDASHYVVWRLPNGSSVPTIWAGVYNVPATMPPSDLQHLGQVIDVKLDGGSNSIDPQNIFITTAATSGREEMRLSWGRMELRE